MVKLARRPVNRNPNSNFARKWTSSSSFYGDSTTPKLLPNLSETNRFLGLPLFLNNCRLKPTKKLRLGYRDEYFLPIYGGSRCLCGIAWTVTKLYCIQSSFPTPLMMFALLASIVQIYNYKYDDKLFTPAPQFESQVVKKDEDVKVLAMVGDEDWLPPPAKVIFTKIISIISKSPLKISAITSLKNAYNGHEEAVPVGDFSLKQLQTKSF
ncbi:hypothetical protein HID58_067266 [Brassica napus]|uniref:Uncharacterized protein n=1 Tax=Brassica napus TaxID=3708 RepID=A0ABQ7ZI19_BRANA|nr:hypothetical protein HID58_067266 [Brassica napus]